MNSVNIVTNYTGGLYAFIRVQNGEIEGFLLTPEEINKLETTLKQFGMDASFLTITLYNINSMPYHVHVKESRQYEVKEVEFDYNDPWLRDLVEDIWYDFIKA